KWVHMPQMGKPEMGVLTHAPALSIRLSGKIDQSVERTCRGSRTNGLIHNNEALRRVLKCQKTRIMDVRAKVALLVPVHPVPGRIGRLTDLTDDHLALNVR